MNDKPIVLMGGRFGDFIHSLVFSDYLYKIYGKKVDLKIGNFGDVFIGGLEKTHKDLYDMLIDQPYINSFEIYNGEVVDYNLNKFRDIPSLYKEERGWTDIYVQSFLGVAYRFFDNVSLTVDKKQKYKDVVVIHQHPDKVTPESLPLYEKIVYNNDCIFLTNNEDWYEQFSYKEQVKLLVPESTIDLFIILNSCKYYVGSQTAFTAIAHILNTPRMIQCVPNFIDNMFYKQEIKYYSNMSYFVSDTDKYISPKINISI